MAELEARSGGACADSAASREPVITNLKLDFTMQLLIKGSLKGSPRQNISCQRRCPKTDSPPIQTCSSQKRFTFQLQVQVKQGMAMADWYAVRESPQCYPFVSRETRRCVDKASYGHRDICLLSPALEREGHRNLKYTTLGPRSRSAKCDETNETGCYPGAPSSHRAVCIELGEGTARYNCLGYWIETAGAGRPNGGAGSGTCDLWSNQVETVSLVRCLRNRQKHGYTK